MGRGTGIGKKDFWILLSGKNKKKGQDTVTSCVCHICLVRLLCLEAGVGGGGMEYVRSLLRAWRKQ